MKIGRLRIYLIGLALLLSGCATMPKSHPNDKAVISYAETVRFMERATTQKNPRAYGRLIYVESKQGYHVMEGTVSPSAIKLTPISVDRYRFRVADSEDVPDFTQFVRVHGEKTVFIRGFWGSEWKVQHEQVRIQK